MKKIMIFCCLTLMCIDIMAQYAGNMNFILFEDDFNVSGRTWDANSYEESGGKWRAYLRGSGITHGTREHQAYQRSQAIFDNNDEMMLLVADYVSETDLSCDDLEIPDGVDCVIDEDGEYNIRYFSGALQSLDKSFLYGYFEIRCKLPVHKGAFPAFWLWSACSNCSVPHYEEIDIFEYTWSITDTAAWHYCHETTGLGDNRCYSAGMYYNTTGDGISDDNSVARIRNRLDDSKPSLDQWNTFGCLWMPDKVEWYINDEMVNSYYNADSIPYNPMYLMANYAIDNYAYDIDSVYYDTNDTFYRFNPIYEIKVDSVYYDANDTMYMDYIRVYQPKWDCVSIVIDEQNDLDYYEHGIKSSVTISSNSTTPLVVDSNSKIDIMASESVTINGPFRIDVGADFSVRMQKCPE